MVTNTPRPDNFADLAPGKPLLRGTLHQAAAWFALGSGTVMVAMAPTLREALAGAVYALSLVVLFAVSATYHRVHWSSSVARAWMRRADHASIFVLIAGTYTPISLLGIGGDAGHRLMIMIWSSAIAGVALSLFWISAPKALTAAVAVAMGWMITPYVGQVRRLLGGDLWLILAGGLAYTAGAIIYALKRPNPWPRSFGYHEIFHALTLVGAAFHLAVIVKIIR